MMMPMTTMAMTTITSKGQAACVVYCAPVCLSLVCLSPVCLSFCLSLSVCLSFHRRSIAASLSFFCLSFFLSVSFCLSFFSSTQHRSLLVFLLLSLFLFVSFCLSFFSSQFTRIEVAQQPPFLHVAKPQCSIVEHRGCRRVIWGKLRRQQRRQQTGTKKGRSTVRLFCSCSYTKKTRQTESQRSLSKKQLLLYITIQYAVTINLIHCVLLCIMPLQITNCN